MNQLVADEVWAKLDPHAGRMAPRAEVRMWIAVLSCLTLGIALYLSGVIVPRVTVNFGGNDSWTDPTTVSAATPIRVDADATLINHGWTTITVTGFDVQLRNTSIATADSAPITLRPGQHVTVNLRFAIASCANTPGGRTPSLRVHVDRWWGTETATASMRGVPDVHDIRSDACRSMALS